MAVGNQPTVQSLNNQLSQLAITLRNNCQAISNFAEYVNQAGFAGLEALGYAEADAQLILSFASYLSTVSGVFFGTVQQGGTGGTGASLFNFGTALAPLYGGG